MTNSTKTSIITTLLVLLFATLARAADNTVWELRLKDGKPTNCQLAFTRVGQDEKDQLYLEADSRGDNNWWHSCITLPKGLLKAGEDYVVALDYEIIEGTEAANAYFYICANSGHLGYPMAPIVGQLYLLRHYDFQKHGIVMFSNTHLSLQDVTIYSFPGIGFVIGGDQHHFELLHCRITYPENEHRSITATGGGLWVGQSQGFIKLEDCDFGYTGDDCVDIHDNIQAGVRRLDDHTLVAEKIVPWMCPFTAGDSVEIRNGDFSPTGFTGKLQAATPNYKNNETTLVFNQELPPHLAFDAILFNLRYGSRNCIIRNCYFHENRAHAILCQTADWLIEGNRFFHNQYPAIAVQADTGRWCVGFGARNVIIRDNKFESANPSGGAVVYVSVDINGSPSRYPLLENVLFENNVFQEMTGPAIEAASFKNLVISNNTFINREKAPIAVKMRGSIRAELGSGLWVGGNQWTTQKGLASPSLFYDADTTQKIVCKSNLLKN